MLISQILLPLQRVRQRLQENLAAGEGQTQEHCANRSEFLLVFRSSDLQRTSHSRLLAPSAAKRRRTEVLRTDGGSATPSLVSAEDDALQLRDARLRLDLLPGATCLEPLVGPDTPFINGMSRSPLIGPRRETVQEISGKMFVPAETSWNKVAFDNFHVNSSSSSALTQSELTLTPLQSQATRFSCCPSPRRSRRV